MCQELLQLATREKPLLIFLDSIDELTGEALMNSQVRPLPTDELTCGAILSIGELTCEAVLSTLVIFYVGLLCLLGPHVRLYW